MIQHEIQVALAAAVAAAGLWYASLSLTDSIVLQVAIPVAVGVIVPTAYLTLRTPPAGASEEPQ